jgi:TonB family protein
MQSKAHSHHLINIMSFFSTKAKQSHAVIMLLVTAVHVAIFLFGLFSFNVRSENGAPIMMMASLIDHPSINTSTKISTNTNNPVPKKSTDQQSQHSDLEKSSDAEEEQRQSEAHQAGAAPVTMPNPFARGLDNPKPPYPLMSRRLNEEGKVVLNVCVSLSGLVENLKLEKTSGHQRLDDIAIETVKKWKFIPAKTQDRDINACYLLPVQFILRKERSRLNG